MSDFPKLIGLTGRAGSGKDTAAAYMVHRHNFANVAFADPIRRAIRTIFRLDPMMFDHPFKEQKLDSIGKSPRELMQTLGTEWGRNCVHPDIWLLTAREAIQDAWHQGQSVVITDVRFENEAQMIRELSGELWHIIRSDAGTPHKHVSEAGIAFVHGDHHVANNDSIQMLHTHVDWKLK